MMVSVHIVDVGLRTACQRRCDARRDPRGPGLRYAETTITAPQGRQRAAALPAPLRR